jgi:hypothetical protein
VRMIAYTHPHAVDPARTTRPTLFESGMGWTMPAAMRCRRGVNAAAIAR